MRFDSRICRTEGLQVAVSNAQRLTRARNAKGLCKPYGQSRTPALSQSIHGMSPRCDHPLPFTTLIYHERNTYGLEQSESVGRCHGMGARLDGELCEEAFGVGFDGLGGNLQLLGDALVRQSMAHRA